MPDGKPRPARLSTASAADDGLEPRFQWHPDARLFGPDGQTHARQGKALPVINEKPAVQALQSVFAASAAGLPFRVGGDNDLPRAAGVPVFETLTGGSTGTPRRIWRSHASWIASFQVNSRLFGIGPTARVAALGDLTHSLALYAGIEALHLGADLHLLSPLRPNRQAEALAERGISHLYATPTQLRQLVSTDPAPTPLIRYLIVGGGALDPALTDALRLIFPNAVQHCFYGAAETSFITLSGLITPPHTAGEAYPQVTIDLRHCDTAGTGEIWVKSPYTAIGYAGDPGSAQWQGQWVTAGELGRWDAGHLIIAGRSSRRLRIADQTVYPEEIEACLLAQPGVRHAAILPREDALRGTVTEAALIGDPAQADAILHALRQRFGPLAAPRRLHWRADWPTLPSGKTDLAQLARDLP